MFEHQQSRAKPGIVYTLFFDILSPNKYNCWGAISPMETLQMVSDRTNKISTKELLDCTIYKLYCGPIYYPTVSRQSLRCTKVQRDICQ